MKRPLGMLSLTAVIVLTGCGGGGSSTSVDSASPSSRNHVENAACRRHAQPVVDVLEKAAHDTDVRDVAGRLDTVDGQLPAATVRCSEAVVRPVRVAFANIDAAFEKALKGQPVGNQLGVAAESLRRAQSALDATG